ncbi:MAG: alpha/beta fold hydrolase, partial [Mariprofundus sp.]
MKTLLRSLLLLALGVSATMVWMLSHENGYIYFPDKQIVQTPQDAGLPYGDIHFTAADGVKLHGWYMPHAQARFTLLHLHGNAGNISDRLAQYRHWHALGLSVFAFDYRGYGNSEGEPSEEGLYADALAAWTLLQNQSKYGDRPIIIAGRSLGCAVAARLAAEVKPAGLALEAPFTSLPDMSRAAYPWLPLYLLVHNQLDTRTAVA